MPARNPGNADTPLPPASHVFSFAQLTPSELRAAVTSVPVADGEEQLTQVNLLEATGQHAALMRIEHPVRLQVQGPLGDYALAFNAGPDVRITGDVGHGVGEGMSRGAIRVRGQAGDGAGTAMTGGTLAIYGSAGHRCGAAMRGGGIFVRGNVGDEAGRGALGGMLVIGGDAGQRLGDAMSNVTVFLRGTATSLAEGVVEAPLRKREQLRLGLLLINASIRGDATDFRRVVPIEMLLAEEQQRGEVSPNWR